MSIFIFYSFSGFPNNRATLIQKYYPFIFYYFMNSPWAVHIHQLSQFNISVINDVSISHIFNSVNYHVKTVRKNLIASISMRGYCCWSMSNQSNPRTWLFARIRDISNNSSGKGKRKQFRNHCILGSLTDLEWVTSQGRSSGHVFHPRAFSLNAMQTFKDVLVAFK